MKEPEKKPQAENLRKEYRAPQLTRWGKLRELTRGGGGTRKEPFTNLKTRF